MVKDLPWYAMPHFLRPLPTLEDKREAMVDMGIPRLVVSMILLPRCKRYITEYESLLATVRTDTGVASV